MTDPDSERDAGFCSGADEDDLSVLHSPSASEDSVEVNVTTISSLRHKRKSVEPKKFDELTDARPLKKRRRYETETSICDEESRSAGSPSPFRPWSASSSAEAKKNCSQKPVVIKQEVPTSKVEEEEAGMIPASKSPEPEEAENLTLEVKREEEVLSRLREDQPKNVAKFRSSVLQRREQRRQVEPIALPPVHLDSRLHQEEPLSLVLRSQYPPRVPSHPAVNSGFERPNVPFSLSSSLSSVSSTSTSSCSMGNGVSSQPRVSNGVYSTPTKNSMKTASEGQQGRQQSGQQRNYKNMTRERRIEANARERTRVHTISAAFDTLRKAIPAYSHNQKLSKLSVLRIACSYILTLGKIIDKSEGEEDKGRDSLESCVDLVSRTIQTEGKLRKKKED